MKARKPEFLEKLVLDPTWKLMAIFTSVMIIFSLCSSIFAAYFACFGEPEGGMAIFDTIMEICFIIDMVRSFFTSYTTPHEPTKPIKDLFQIIKHYLKGAFFFEALALSAWPIRLAVRNSWDEDNVGLIYLLRVLRVSKILILMNLQNFSNLVKSKCR